MKENDKTILWRILNLDRRILYILTIALMSWVLIKPIGLPIQVDEINRNYYDTIESLPPGSIVFASLDIEAGMWGEIGPQMIATLQHLMNKDVKFIQVCFYRADGQFVFETMVLPKVNQQDKVYGVDWVNFGYIEGHETAMSAFANNFHLPVKDAYGNMLEDLPIMDELNDMNDIDLYIDMAGGDVMQAFRQFVVPYDTYTLAGIQASNAPEMQIYIDSGDVHGMLNGLAGAAQYEYLLGKPGLAIKGTDALSVISIYLFILITITNISYVIQRRQRGIK